MIEEKLVQILEEKNLTISSVESCTGGSLINRITNVEGASEVTNGGIVTYSNSQKIKLGVPAKIIRKYGVYSEECAETMAGLGMELFESDISIGITGTLSNLDPNNMDSEEGKVYYSIMIKENGKYLNLNSVLLVAIRERSLQKEYIVDQIILELNRFLENKYRL